MNTPSTLRYALFGILLFLCFPAQTQNRLSVNVVDAETGEHLVFANVFLRLNNSGSSTNLEGRADIPIKNAALRRDTLSCSYVGYRDTSLVVNLKQSGLIRLALQPQQVLLQEVAVVGFKSKAKGKMVVKKAIRRVRKNYPQSSQELRGFYREMVKEENRYAQLNEAFFKLHYTSYPQKRYARKAWNSFYATYPTADYWVTEQHPLYVNAQYFKYHNTPQDQCEIIAARASSYESKDDIEPIPLNGPLDMSAADKVKYQADFLDPRLLRKYVYKRVGASYIDGVLCHVVSFQPKKLKMTRSQDMGKKVRIPIYSGKLYISIDDFAVVKYECQVVDGAIPKSRYRNHIPASISLSGEYQQIDGKWYLKRIKSEQLLDPTSCHLLKTNKTILRFLEVQEIETKHVKAFAPSSPKALNYGRYYNLRYFPTSYDSLFWANPQNYIALPEEARLDLEKQKSLHQQFKEQFFQKKLPLPSPPMIPDTSFFNRKDYYIDEYQWLQQASKITKQYIKEENRYFKNYFIPYRSEFREAFYNATNKIKLCAPPDTSRPILENDFSAAGRFGLLWHQKDTSLLLVDFDKELCADCRILNYSLNADSTLLAYKVYNAKQPDSSIVYIKDIQHMQIKEQLSDISNFTWFAKDILLYLLADPTTKRDYALGSYAAKSNRQKLLFEAQRNTEEVEYYYTSDRKDLIFFLITDGQDNRLLQVEESLKVRDVLKMKVPLNIYGWVEDEDFWYALVRKPDQLSHVLKRSKLNKASLNVWESMLSGTEEELIDEIAVSANYLVMKIIENGKTKVFKYPKANLDQRQEIHFPEKHFSISFSMDSLSHKDTLSTIYSSLNQAFTALKIDLNNDRQVHQPIYCPIAKRREISPHYSTKIYQVPTADGQQSIPLRISQSDHPQQPLKGLILKVYGAYGAFPAPDYDEFEAYFMDQGYLIAQAYVRGGRAKGWGWYDQGRLLNKQNSIDDYLSCARYVLAQQLAPQGNLIARGQSAGGLVIGAAINQAPELFKVAVFDYPYLDVLSTMANDSLPLTTLEYSEWGNPKKATHYEYIKTYSPYQNISSQAYPAMIFFAGINDFQTPYWQVVSSTLRYRQQSSNQSDIILHIGRNGHPGSIPYGQRAKEMIYEYLFIENTIGGEN